MGVTAVNNISRQALIRELWRRGELTFKMHKVQREMFELYKAAEPNSTLVWLLARQSGKSYCLALLGLMEAIQNPNSIIKLLTDTKLHVKSIFEPLFQEILEDCPEDLRPTYNPSLFLYKFPNGSQIQMAGSDGNTAERLRGQKSKLVLVDEAGFCNKLNYNIKSILLPTTTHTGGKIILASTPPEDPDHEFVGFIEEAYINKALTKKTIHDNPLLEEKVINSIISKFPGGESNPQFRREYLCEIIKDENKSVIPEATEETLRELIQDYPRPVFYDAYVGLDIGFKDLTVILFGYYDFKMDKLIIEDEIVKTGTQLKLKEFAEEILKKEEELWTDPITLEQRKVYCRVSDIDHIVVQELHNHSNNKLHFNMVRKEKGFKPAIINNIRMMISNKKIIINPKCETLIRHLINCKWKDVSEKDDFSRSPDAGHYDAVDALVYLVKSLNVNHNPYPAGYNMSMTDLFVRNPSNFYNQNNTSIDVYRQIFGPKKK